MKMEAVDTTVAGMGCRAQIGRDGEQDGTRARELRASSARAGALSGRILPLEQDGRGVKRAACVTSSGTGIEVTSGQTPRSDVQALVAPSYI
jgi:hypothetical protein